MRKFAGSTIASNLSCVQRLLIGKCHVLQIYSTSFGIGPSMVMQNITPQFSKKPLSIMPRPIPQWADAYSDCNSNWASSRYDLLKVSPMYRSKSCQSDGNTCDSTCRRLSSLDRASDWISTVGYVSSVKYNDVDKTQNWQHIRIVFTRQKQIISVYVDLWGGQIARKFVCLVCSLRSSLYHIAGRLGFHLLFREQPGVDIHISQSNFNGKRLEIHVPRHMGHL